MICRLGALLGSLAAVIGTGAVEQAIKSLANLGVSGSIVQITPGVVGYAVLGAVTLGFFWWALSILVRSLHAASRGHSRGSCII